MYRQEEVEQEGAAGEDQCHPSAYNNETARAVSLIIMMVHLLKRKAQKLSGFKILRPFHFLLRNICLEAKQGNLKNGSIKFWQAEENHFKKNKNCSFL